MSRHVGCWIKQPIVLEFTIDPKDVELKLTGSEASKINDKIIELINECAIGENLDIEGARSLEYEDGCFEEKQETIFNESTDIHIELLFYAHVYGTYTYDPGCMYLSNGDPGNPPYEEYIPEEGYITDINMTKFITGMKSLPVIGQYIEEDSIYIYADEEFPCDNLDQDDDDYEPEYDKYADMDYNDYYDDE